MEFVLNDWSIHEKFFNYLLNMAVTPYSKGDDISFVQELLKAYYPEHMYDEEFFYPAFYSDNMRTLVYDFQRKQITYTYGDLNRDGVIDENDLIIMREWLYAHNPPITLDRLRGYLDGTLVLPLTNLELEWADVNRDGVIDEADYILYLKYITPYENPDTGVKFPREFSSLQRTFADVNHDNKVDYMDYNIMKANVDGLSQSLKIYGVKFALGWYDMQTEYLMEKTINYGEQISEVSK